MRLSFHVADDLGPRAAVDRRVVPLGGPACRGAPRHSTLLLLARRPPVRDAQGFACRGLPGHRAGSARRRLLVKKLNARNSFVEGLKHYCFLSYWPLVL